MVPQSLPLPTAPAADASDKLFAPARNDLSYTAESSNHSPSGSAPMPNPLCGVLYQSWPQPDGSFRLEFLSADAERLLEATADEFAARWLDRTLPLFGVDADEFYRN